MKLPPVKNPLNCWNPLRAHGTTTWPVKASVKV